MSGIGSFIKSLVPGFKRDNLLKDLESFRKELNEHNKPIMQAGAEFFSNYQLKSKENQGFEMLFKNKTKMKARNFVDGMNIVTQNLEDVIDLVTSLVKDGFGHDIIKDGITYRKANVIALVESIGFFLRYSRTRLHYTYILETSVVGSVSTNAISKASQHWLKENENAFFAACSSLSKTKQEITTAIKSVADVVYDESTDEVVSVVNHRSSTDPLNNFVVGTTFNIFYHGQMWLADWQVDRLKAAKEEQRALNYRLINLKELIEGRNDPKMQTEIEEVEGLLLRLNATIAKKEEAFANGH